MIKGFYLHGPVSNKIIGNFENHSLSIEKNIFFIARSMHNVFPYAGMIKVGEIQLIKQILINYLSFNKI